MAGHMAALVVVVGLVAARAVTAQTAVETVLVDGIPVHPAAYGFVYYSTLSPSDLALRDGSRAELWMFDGAGADCVEAVGRSEAFPVYLVLRDGAPFGPLVADSPGAVGQGARLRVTLPRAGRYFLMVTSVGRGEALGAYVLDLDRCGA
jgi:hypothetical protein